MYHMFELHASNVVGRVGRYDFHIGHEKGRVQLRIGNTSRYVTAGHADLVQQIAIGSDKRVVGLAAKDIDCPARNILARKSTRLNSSHSCASRMPSSA